MYEKFLALVKDETNRVVQGYSNASCSLIGDVFICEDGSDGKLSLL